ncbi:hypothetical protein M0R45_017559 [Rubus argutus]|uniref:Uncharacterized protein n=1 Tax=Rubus argutus TaxID=59490 RepID=A0AAW1XWU0_RUBAR
MRWLWGRRRREAESSDVDWARRWRGLLLDLTWIDDGGWESSTVSVSISGVEADWVCGIELCRWLPWKIGQRRGKEACGGVGKHNCAWEHVKSSTVLGLGWNATVVIDEAMAWKEGIDGIEGMVTGCSVRMGARAVRDLRIEGDEHEAPKPWVMYFVQR